MSKASSIRTRFAPSPTGYLHIGNARIAAVNYLFAKKHNGKFILRIDDTDKSRFDSRYLERIYEDLDWLGINCNLTFKQSDQALIYRKYIDAMINAEMIYPCYETEDELDQKREAAAKAGKPFIYDRQALLLTKTDKAKLESDNKPKYYRFKLQHKEVVWDDMIKGEIKFQGDNLSDPIVLKSNGEIVYLLASVIDDVRSHISHIIRGEDHITNTALQIQMFEAVIKIHNHFIDEINLSEASSDNSLSGSNYDYINNPKNEIFSLDYCKAIPSFGHLGLIKAKDGKISKRIGGFDLENLRKEKHINPLTLMNFLVFLGTSKNIHPYVEQADIVKHFDINSYSKSPTEYNEEDILIFNKKIVQNIPFKLIKKQYPEVTQDFWDSVKYNLNNEFEITEWQNIIFNPTISQSKDSNKLLIAKSLLTYIEEHNVETLDLKDMVENLSKSSINDLLVFNIKDVYKLLREILISGREGIELKILLKLLSKDKIIERIKVFIYGA